MVLLTQFVVGIVPDYPSLGHPLLGALEGIAFAGVGAGIISGVNGRHVGR
jgi:hypothetical protein